MKKFTLLCAGLMAAMGVNAQLMVDWNDEGQCTFYPEDLVCEGGISYDADNACFVSDGTPGKLMLNLEGKTIDFSEVARIEVNGSEYKDNPWGNDDPVGTLKITDAVNGVINQWYGSRYNVDYKDYAEKSAKVDSVYFTVRYVEVTNDAGEVTESYNVAGEFYIDEIVLTKSVEQDPNAITAEMWHRWIGIDENAVIDEADDNPGAVVNLNTTLGAGSVVAGQGSGTVKYWAFADLTPYKGIYIKGTPGMQFRLMFNRAEDAEDGTESADFIEVNPEIPEEGEVTVYFSEALNSRADNAPAFEGVKYIHLLCCKTGWGSAEGKVAKFNYVTEGSSVDAVSAVEVQDSAIYNVFGQRVDENYRGIVIKNGKKFINK